MERQPKNHEFRNSLKKLTHVISNFCTQENEYIKELYKYTLKSLDHEMQVKVTGYWHTAAEKDTGLHKNYSYASEQLSYNLENKFSSYLTLTHKFYCSFLIQNNGKIITGSSFFVLFHLTLYVPVNNLSVMSGRVSRGWTSTIKQLIKWFAQRHNTSTRLAARL